MKETNSFFKYAVGCIASIILLFSIFLVFRSLLKNPVSKNTVSFVSPLPISSPVTSPATTSMRRSVAAPGRQSYSISQAHRSPNFTQAIIDPEDVRLGQKQTMTVYINDEKAPITEVVAEIQTDKEIIKYPLQRVSGTDQDGVWESSWIVKDTHDTTYVTTFKAVNNIGETGEARLSWTDPGCSTNANHGTSVTISANCTISGVDGADGGIFTVSGGTVTIAAGGTLSAASFSLSGGALVKNNDTGVVSIVAGSVICMTDADADGYSSATTQYADGAACAGGRRRRYLMTAVATLDCNDAVYSATNTCCTDTWVCDTCYDTCCASCCNSVGYCGGTCDGCASGPFAGCNPTNYDVWNAGHTCYCSYCAIYYDCAPCVDCNPHSCNCRWECI